MSDIEIVVASNAEELAQLAAQRVVSAVASSSSFRLALAGGSTPQRLYELLARRKDLDYNRVELCWGDERVVPADDESSNYRMVRRALLDHISIPPTQVHRIETERGGAAAAAAYAPVIAERPFDLVLLGMGDDGHTASIFPGGNDEDGVFVSESPVPPRERVSIGIDVINAAGAALMLVSGAGKAKRLAEVYRQIHAGRPTLPAARVRPKRLCWLLDAAAASHLQIER